VSLEQSLLIVFIVLVLLPWFGGLFLTVTMFLYARDTIRYQSQRIKDLKNENTILRSERFEMEQEVHKTSLSLQATLLENAMLSARADSGRVDDQSAAG